MGSEFIYEKTVKSLLYLESVGEIKRFLDETEGIDPKILLQSFDKFEQTLVAENRNAERELERLFGE